jgi:hypothetical protein
MKAITAIMIVTVVTCTPHVLGQSHGITACVTQLEEGQDIAQLEGRDAKPLSEELSSRQLAKGIPITVAAIVGRSQHDIDAGIERAGCEYVIRVWRHESTTRLDDAPSQVANIGPVQDQDTVDYEIRQSGTGKQVGTGMGLRPYRRGRTHLEITPYASLADRIVKQIDKREGRQ